MKDSEIAKMCNEAPAGAFMKKHANREMWGWSILAFGFWLDLFRRLLHR